MRWRRRLPSVIRWDEPDCPCGTQDGRRGENPMKKIACLFPGIGYTCDKPLLYYSWKLLKGLGWEVVPVPYTGFPSGVKGNLEKMQQAAHMALEQAEEMLQGIEWNDYSDILLIGRASERLCAPRTRSGTVCGAGRYSLRQSRQPSSLLARSPLCFTGRRIPGQIRRWLRIAAIEWVFRCMKQKRPIIPWKPGT